MSSSQNCSISQPTSKPLYLQNFDMCRLYNRLWEPIKALRWKGGEINGWLTPLPWPGGPLSLNKLNLASMHTSTSRAMWCVHLW
jgi:hypothetical protein